MMSYPYTFIVNGYNHDRNTYYEQCGVGVCSSFADASTQIEQRYGDELVSIKHLCLHDADIVINVPKETLKQIIDLLEGTDICSAQISESEANKI